MWPQQALDDSDIPSTAACPSRIGLGDVRTLCEHEADIAKQLDAMEKEQRQALRLWPK